MEKYEIAVIHGDGTILTRDLGGGVATTRAARDAVCAALATK